MHCNDYDNMNNANNYYGYDDNCIMTKYYCNCFYTIDIKML